MRRACLGSPGQKLGLAPSHHMYCDGRSCLQLGAMDWCCLAREQQVSGGHWSPCPQMAVQSSNETPEAMYSKLLEEIGNLHHVRFKNIGDCAADVAQTLYRDNKTVTKKSVDRQNVVFGTMEDHAAIKVSEAWI